FLTDVAAKMTRYHFSCQYLNDPLPDDDVIFPLRSLNFFDPSVGLRRRGEEVLEMPKILYHFVTLDPSLGEHADSDWSAFVIIAVDAEWNLYLPEVYRDRIQNEGIIEQMFRIHQVYAPMRFGVEAIAFQKSIIWGFEQACRQRGVWFHVEELRTDNQITKEMRIRGFQPFWKAGKVYCAVEPGTDLTLPRQELYHFLLKGQDVLVDEALRFPLGATKDCIDALAYAPQLVFPAGPPQTDTTPKPGSFGHLISQLKKDRYGQTHLRTR